MDNETDPQNNDLVFVPPDQKVNEAKAKQMLVALRKSLTRKTVIPDVRFEPADPMDTDYSTPVFLGALFSKNGIDIRSKLPQFQRRPDGKNVVLSRTFPDPTMGRLLPTFTQSEVIFLTDTIAPSIEVQSTGFPDDPNLFHIMGSVVEEDLAAGLDVANWDVTLSLYAPNGQLLDGLIYHVSDRFPLTRQPDGTFTFDSFIRFVDPLAGRAVLTFKAMDLNGNRRKAGLNFDLVAAVFLDPSAANPEIPVNTGDGLNGHFVQTSNTAVCCSWPDLSQADEILSRQLGDPGVVAVLDQMITTNLDLGPSQIPLTGSGAGRMSGFIWISAPGVQAFRVESGFLGACRLSIGGRLIINQGETERAVYFPSAGFYAFEIVYMFNYYYSYPDLEVQMEPGEQVQYGSPFVPAAILYKTLDAD
jgi:hypothetical protein